jgi:tRNA(fMet)-specific endonuclease VapC
MWVLDTNTLIYFFKGEGDVAQQLLTKSPLDIGIPAIVLLELEVGIAKSSSPKKRRQQLAELVSVVKVLPFGDKEAKAAATVRVQLENAGLPIGPHDTLIAGTAIANGGILVTRNTREFERVAGLQLENWF